MLTAIHQLDAAEVSLQDTEQALREAMPHSGAGSSAGERAADIRHLPGEVAAIRAVIASLRGDVPRTIECARQALERLAQENVLMRGTTALSLGRAYLWSGDLAAAEQVLAEASTINQVAGNMTAALISRYSLGHLSVMQGELHRAAEIYRTILDDMAQMKDALPVASLVHIGMGELLYEWYELKAAEEHVLLGFELGKQWGSSGSLLHGFMCMELIKLAYGDFNDALLIQQQMEQAVERNKLSQMQAIIKTFRIRLEIAQGKSESISRWIQETASIVNTAPTFHTDFEHLTLARAYLVQEQYDEARGVLEQLLREATQRRRSMLEGLVLLTRALQGQNEVEQAKVTLIQALVLAEPEGFISIFVSEGQSMAALLMQVLDLQRKERSAAAQHISPGYIRKLLALLRGEAPLPSKDTHQQRMGSGETIESLSERELEVLQRLAAGMSNQAIAREFIVSVGTVKTHLNHIYGKLNVHSRTQAVARARALHLLA